MSTTFIDRLGRHWDCTLTMAGARRIDASDFSLLTDHKFSILSPTPEFFTELLVDTRVLFAMMWAVVYPQAAQHDAFKDLTPEEAQDEFLNGLDGSAIQAGREAFWEAIAGFFPEQKTGLSSIMRQHKTAQRKLTEKLGTMEPEIDAFVDREIEKGLAQIRQQLQ